MWDDGNKKKSASRLNKWYQIFGPIQIVLIETYSAAAALLAFLINFIAVQFWFDCFFFFFVLVVATIRRLPKIYDYLLMDLDLVSIFPWSRLYFYYLFSGWSRPSKLKPFLLLNNVNELYPIQTIPSHSLIVQIFAFTTLARGRLHQSWQVVQTT